MIIISSWTIDARGFAWLAGTERVVKKRGPKPENVAGRIARQHSRARRYR